MAANYLRNYLPPLVPRGFSRCASSAVNVVLILTQSPYAKNIPPFYDFFPLRRLIALGASFCFKAGLLELSHSRVTTVNDCCPTLKTIELSLLNL